MPVQRNGPSRSARYAFGDERGGEGLGRNLVEFLRLVAERRIKVALPGDSRVRPRKADTVAERGKRRAQLRNVCRLALDHRVEPAELNPRNGRLELAHAIIP